MGWKLGWRWGRVLWAKVEQVDVNNEDADPEGRGEGRKALDQGVLDEGSEGANLIKAEHK